MLLVVVFQVLLLLWSNDPFPVAEAQHITKTGCETSCGGVLIPYPFGMKAGCYLEERYKIQCKSSRLREIPILSINGAELEVAEISVYGGTAYANFPAVSANCGDGGREGNRVVDLEGSPFVFSSQSNYFVAKGCDAFAFMTQNQSTVGGCFSICGSAGSVDITSCSGINCCQTSIPQNLKVFNVSFEDLAKGPGDNGVRGDDQKCRVAYLIEQRYVDWSYRTYLEPDKEYYPPVVLEWGINTRVFQSLAKNQSFFNPDHRNTASYSCESLSAPPMNSTNQDSIVRCFCKTDIEGNPYLIQMKGNPYLNGRCALTEELDQYNNQRHHLKAKLITGLVIGVGFGALFLLIGLWWLCNIFKRRRNEKLKKMYFKRNGGLLLEEQLSTGEVHMRKIKMFTSKELDKATDHYNVDRMLGQGGQGTVYKGMLTDGKIVAVKKSKVLDERKLRQFINEVVILSQINHKYVVKLLGCCLETEVPLLVYEFIQNGTLFELLHDPNEEFPLTWEIRLRIAIEVSGALFYLHSAASIPIFHRDIKSSNILLDDKYRAKVADFGISRTLTEDKCHVTTLVQGTFGYFDPEYFRSNQFTDKSDVYSFGVVLVELLTGQKPITSITSELGVRSLITYFISSMDENRLFDILHPQVLKHGKKEELAMVAGLAKRCLNLNGKERPTMKEVNMVLEGIQKSQDGITDEKSPNGFNTIKQDQFVYDTNQMMGTEDLASILTDFGLQSSDSVASSPGMKPLLNTV